MVRLDVDLSVPPHDLTTYAGRAAHFLEVTDFRLALATEQELLDAKRLLEQHAEGDVPDGTTEADLRRAQRMYESAFHPQTGELMWRFGRMSFAPVGNTIIGGCMLTFYQTTPAVVLWQVVNQSFNAALNYVNRNTSSSVTRAELAGSFAVATGSATAVALGLNRAVKSRPALAAGLVGRLVPFAAVAAANCVNLPLMRRKELAEGLDLEDERGRPIVAPPGADGSGAGPVKSTEAAKVAIGSTVLSRVLMAMPGMIIPPIVVTQLQRRTALLRRFPRLELPLQVVLTGVSVAFATPLGCAVFPQRSSLAADALEPAARARLAAVGHAGPIYFNKGL